MESAVIDAAKPEELRQAKIIFTTNGKYEQTRQSVTSLLFAEEDEEFMHPTQYALDLTLSLLENANADLVTRGTQFPRGTSSTSDRGGVYLFWEENGNSIQLEVPPKNGGMLYIHFVSSQESIMNKNVSSVALADALTKLTSSRKLGISRVPASAATR
ncbi:MAG: hypothetical protein ACRYFS_24340 [Janthinobacterium lividum]